MTVPDAIEIRAVQPGDRSAVLALLRRSLGRDEDERFEELYAWKHETNPFGRSYGTVAVDAASGRLAGFRALMRWRFRAGDETVAAVRAVDTATDPEYQGRGIFTKLTLAAIDDLRSEGVGFVFNTPNDQSRPGYLKMGWQQVGRVPIGVRPSGPAGVVRLARARTAADRWSLPLAVGRPAEEVLADPAVDELIEAQPPRSGLTTDRSSAYLRWRYGSAMLGYRAVMLGSTPADGLVIGRARRRGAARELVVGDVLAPAGSVRAARRLVARFARHAGADYVLMAGSTAEVLQVGLVPAPRLGPILTWRDVCSTAMPPRSDWHLSMGDVELF